MFWIPGIGGMNLEKGINNTNGNLIEENSVLGPLFSVSFFPNTLALRSDARFKKVGDKLESELKSAKSQ